MTWFLPTRGGDVADVDVYGCCVVLVWLSKAEKFREKPYRLMSQLVGDKGHHFLVGCTVFLY
jgi:hypothetical protein